MMTDEAKKVNDASRSLFALEMERHQRAVNEIALQAMKVDGVDPATTSLSLDTMTYAPKPIPA